MLTMNLRLDTPFYWIPDMVAGKICSVLLNRMRSGLIDATSNWESREWKSRIESGPRAAYYKALSDRINAMLQRKT